MGDKTKEMEPARRKVGLIVPKQHVKTVKTALERHDKFDRTARIVPEIDAAARGLSSRNMHIPTTISYHLAMDSTLEDRKTFKLDVLQDLGLHFLFQDVELSYHTPTGTAQPQTQDRPLRKAIHEALDTLPSTILSDLNLTPSTLADAFPLGYSIYPPLLLLPHNAFTSPPWTLLLSTHPLSSLTLQPMWTHLASAMKTTHIAINSPIPLTSTTEDENILRSPVNITPLYGSFGPLPTAQTMKLPTASDFESALWVSTIQNGIYQTWAPMYTMFSRGNIREKTRLLNALSSSESTPSSTSQEEEEEEGGGGERGGESVVDMYAGIGYFAFSYRAAGKRPVFCFELNPWSVEGLRRGVELNGWTCRIISEDEIGVDGLDIGGDGDGDGDVDFYIYHTSNANALPFLTPLFTNNQNIRSLPPIRHINLGLLPHSRDTWRDAVALLDTTLGGWIRAHENVGEEEMEDRKVEVEGLFQGYLDEGGGRRKARVEHVERVKMYAPGVVHCVFDVWVEGEGGG
jgi:tRNA wybutosine-synthesizing protein 2